MTDTAISVKGVSKMYNIRERGYRTLRDDTFRFIKSVFRRNLKLDVDTGILWALKDINFEVKKGQALGIIGPNGAGKSTILKLLAKVTLPTSGVVSVNGRVGALIELGTGFHPELTGKENIYLYGSIVGMKKSEIDERYNEIVEFAELENFMDTPLKRYSSGMHARLGFSISSHIDADVLLIDEVLSVGDFDFQNKCLKRMQKFVESNTAIVFVSHNLESVEKLCQKTLLLNEGEIIVNGNISEAIRKYYEVISRKQCIGDSDNYSKSTNKRAEITGSQLLDKSGKPSLTFATGDIATFKYIVTFNDDINNPSFGFFVRRSDGLIVFDTSTYRRKIKIKKFKSGSRVLVEFKFVVNLLKGIYHIGNFIGDEQRQTHDYIDSAITFSVSGDISNQGIVNLEAEWRIVEETSFICPHEKAGANFC